MSAAASVNCFGDLSIALVKGAKQIDRINEHIYSGDTMPQLTGLKIASNVNLPSMIVVPVQPNLLPFEQRCLILRTLFNIYDRCIGRLFKCQSSD